jgi:hypothetical protein
MTNPIVLIGPMSAGKSTVAQLLAARLGLPRYELDERRWDYYQEIGYDPQEATRIAHGDEGMAGLLNYWKPFEAHAVERALAEYRDCILDFGAGHSVYEDEGLFRRVQKALSAAQAVILLLPSPDLEESTAVVNGRFSEMVAREGIPIDPAVLRMNEQFVKHPSNHRLATMTVYTAGRTPEETCEEIVSRLGFERDR